MFILDGRGIYSASDLTSAATCEWAFMRKFDAKLGRIDPVVDPVDDMLSRTAALGDLHEHRTLDTFRATREVVEFERPDLSVDGALQAAADATTHALRAGAEVLFQATFFDGRFLGYADFILRDPSGQYEVYDTKLARKAKITALLQLAAYSEQLERLGIPIGEHVYLLLGDGSTSTHRIADILPVYRKRRARLQQLIDERVADTAETAWGDPRYSICGHCPTCEEQVGQHNDVLLVAGMRLGQRKKLAEAGITTIEQLAVEVGPVTGMADATLTTLREQAALQTRAITATIPGPAQPPSVQLPSVQSPLPPSLEPLFPPPYEVFNPDALGALPEPDPGDIFFDFEGDPLYSEDNGPEWGLDYLFGMIETDGSFRAFWAHDHAQERQALIDFLAYVEKRRQRHPKMHIYHYASYERTHLLSLAARHGVGEVQVDDLLREHVLVDLYPIVKKSVRVGSRSYSIKKLEPLYMGDEHRKGVDNAADSITEYVEACLLREAGDTSASQAKLDAIAHYNEYDCLSTLRLRDWLLERAAEYSLPQFGGDELELEQIVREPDPVYLELAELIAGVPPADRNPDQTALALASAAIDYHRREAKKFWQEHFDRLRNPTEEWADTRDVLVVDTISLEEGWHREGRQKLDRRVLRVTGTLAPGSSIKIGHKPFLLYDPPFPPIKPSREPGARTAHDGAEVIEIVEPIGSDVPASDSRVSTVYFVQEQLESDAPQHDALPMAFAPGKPPRAGKQIEAIAGWGRRILDAYPDLVPDAAFDILRRQPPRGHLVPIDPDASSDVISAIRDSLLGIDRSYLAVQGPPGTGKTFTGSRVIAQLAAEHGWKIGVVAQSHASVENMLKAVVDTGLDPRLIGKKPKKGDQSPVPWTALDEKSITTFTSRQSGFVLGGTAWDFSHPDRVPPGSLDLLVIDEAGQFSLASTIASSVAATRLLLLGDPQQLPQVSQGSHPEPVDESALGWLADGHNVLPPEMGYFLAKSWRMHPDVCAPVSGLSYEGQLQSVAAARLLADVEPGLHAIEVPHTLNATTSSEEADRVVELVRYLIGKAWTCDGQTRPLAENDVIVVAPYNAQVDLLQQRLSAAGLMGVPVGTVDKFQGREAAIAIVSLTASSAEEVPRGLEFLLLPNRLNVAISRAQWAAFLVYSPALTEALPSNVTLLKQLSAFITLVESPLRASGD